MNSPLISIFKGPRVIVSTVVTTTPYNLNEESPEVLSVNATSSNIVINLPAISTVPGRAFTVIKTNASANLVVITANGSDLIEGASSLTLNFQYESNTLVNDGLSWFRLSTNAAGGSGVSSLTAIGSSANADGATITGTVLNLQPASTSFGGVVTTGTQSFAGAKTFTGALTIAGSLAVDTDVLFVDPTLNRVGVNTISPGKTFDVVGAIRGTTLDSATWSLYTTTAANVPILSAIPAVAGTPSNIMLHTSPTFATNSLLIIGTEVSGSSYQQSNSVGDGMFIWSGNTPGGGAAFDLYIGAHAHDGFTGFDPNKMMTFVAASPYNVGIGTASPGQRLSVVGTIESTTGGFKFPNGTTQTAAAVAITLAAIGGTANANAASLSGQVLTLQPASASFGGIVTTGAQTIAGDKTFAGNAVFTSTTAPAVTATTNTSLRWLATNASNGTTAAVGFLGTNDLGRSINIMHTSSGYSAIGALAANVGFVGVGSASDALVINNQNIATGSGIQLTANLVPKFSVTNTVNTSTVPILSTYFHAAAATTGATAKFSTRYTSSSTSDEAFRFEDDSAPGAFFKIYDGTSIAGDMMPAIWAKGGGASGNIRNGLTLYGEPHADISTHAAIRIDGRLNGSALTAANILSVATNNTDKFTINTSAAVFSTSVTVGGLLHPSGTASITAFAGGGQGSATALTTTTNFVATVATAADSVRLPTPVLGTVVIVFNTAVNSLNVFPVSGGAINALGTNTAIAIAGGASLEFYAQSTTQWHTR